MFKAEHFALIDNQFYFFPMSPEGYIGYTDYTSMQCQLNDSLMDIESQDQFWFAGFGEGFTRALIERNEQLGTDQKNLHRVLQITLSHTSENRKSWKVIQWLKDMQKLGTDNFGQSTSNLARCISSICTFMSQSGPIREKYWSRYHRKKAGAPDPEKPDENTLKFLSHIMNEAQDLGYKIGLENVEFKVEAPTK
ncbi:MAG: hypothetical protein H3C28_15440 [Sphingomonadales bacterium]|nr:hypothetical protein [Sphingomonadales bacterium]